jgi:hypothetical protein
MLLANASILLQRNATFPAFGARYNDSLFLP